MYVCFYLFMYMCLLMLYLVPDWKQITISLVKQIIEALPTICSSYIEAIMFASIFSLAFFGFFENRRISLI